MITNKQKSLLLDVTFLSLISFLFFLSLFFLYVHLVCVCFVFVFLNVHFLTSGASSPEWVKPTAEGEGICFRFMGFCFAISSFFICLFVVFVYIAFMVDG
jgi:hypothetical protein